MKTHKRSTVIFVAALFGAFLLALTLADANSPVRAQGSAYAPAACPTPISKTWNIKGNCGTVAGKNFLGTTDNQALVVKTNKVERMRIDTSGNVGIGTTAPIARLDTRGGTSDTDYSLAVLSDPGVLNRGGLLLHQNAGQGFVIHAQSTAAQSTAYMRFNYVNTSTGATLQSDILTLRGNGNVGIGTINPAFPLDVAGSANIAKGLSSVPFALAALQAHNGGASGEAGLFRTESASNPSAVVKMVRDASGANDFLKCTKHNADNSETQLCHIDSAGTYHAGSDFAEALTAKGGKSGYEPGDVVVVGDSLGIVEKSSHPYDARVAGVYSTRPAVLGEDAGGTAPVDGDDIPVAVIGIVPTKVTMENGAIAPGDLLTTSSTPGYAMKAKPVVINGVEIYPTGAILGKALESLDKATGIIQVLVTLR